MVSLIFTGLVKLPVFLEVFARAQRAQTQDCFRSAEAPSSSGQPHPVLHQVPAGSFDDARADGETRGKVLVVGQVVLVLE